MANKLKLVAACLTAVAGFSASAGALAEDVQGRLSVIYSPHKTDIHAPGYLISQGQLPRDPTNKGSDYWGVLGEINLGKISLGLDYLTGTSNSISGALDFTPNSPTFNPLTHEQSETLALHAGYTVLDNPVIGKMDATLGYFRMWAQPSISPANWYDGLEIGVKGRRSWDGGFAITYRLGYLPSVSAYGYVADENLMEGKTMLNFRVGAEVPVTKNISAIGGYQKTRAVNKVVVDGSDAIVNFSGFYIGGMFSF